MSCQNFFYGAEMIIFADRYEEAVEWFEDKFGFDLGESGIDHKLSASGERMILDLDPIGEVGGYDFFDTLKMFFEEFACNGSYANILTEDDGTWYSRIEMQENKLFEESYEGQDLFEIAEKRIDSAARMLAKHDLVKGFSEGVSKWSEVRIWADYSEDGTLRDIRGYVGDDQDDPGVLIGFIDMVTGQFAYVDQMMAYDPLVQEAVKAELESDVGKQRPKVGAAAEGEDKAAAVTGVLRALEKADPGRYGNLFKTAPEFLESLDGTFAFLVFSDTNRAVNVSGDSPAALARAVLNEVLGDGNKNRYVSVDTARSLTSQDAGFLDGAKAAQKGRPKIEQTGTGKKQ